MSKTEWTSNRQARPAAAGTYWVTLEWPEREVSYTANGAVKEIHDTGRLCREVTQRDYGRPRNSEWETGERVVAWMGPIEPPEVYREELAEGYEYVWE